MATQPYQAKDSVPLPPKNAEVLTTACDYCIVACGYKIYRWPVGREGGPKASQNALGVDYPVAPMSGKWISPNMHNVVSHNGRPHNVVVMPDGDATVVNIGGGHSVRGGALAQKCYNPTTPTRDRLKSPMIRVYDTLMPVDWDTALDVAAELSTYVIDKYGESAWAQKQYSYEFYENTYALTKFALRYINTPAFSPHDQPGPGSSTPGFRDTGFQNYAPSYWDWGNADTLLISGTDPYETKTIIFNNWILPGIQDRGMKVIYVLPRRTTGVAFAEKNGGLFLQINPGTDMALHMALTRYIIEQGWQDQEWIDKWVATKWGINSGFGQGTRNTPWQWRTTWGGKFTAGDFNQYKKWLLGQKESEMGKASEITGIPASQIKKAAAMMAKPVGGKRPKTSIGIEKGNYWSNNYLNTASIAALSVIIGTGGRPGQMIGRFGGHQRGGMSGGGYPRAKSPEKHEGRRKKPIDLDRWVTTGHVRMAHVVGTTWTSAMGGTQYMQKSFNRLTRLNPHQVRSMNKQEIIKTLKKRVDSGGMVLVNTDIYLRPIGNTYADIVLPAAGWGEEDFTRNNGERRLRLYSKFNDAPGMAKPDWWIIAQWAKKMGFKGFDWKNSNEICEEAARHSRGGIRAYHNLVWLGKKKGMTAHETIRMLGTTGIQTPTILVPTEWSENRPGQEYVGGHPSLVWNGLKVVGTVRAQDTERKLPETGPVGPAVWPKWLTKFNSQTGKNNLMKTPWKMWADFYDWWKPGGTGEKGEMWIINGRINEIWQSGYDDVERRPYITQRWPENWVEINPKDARRLGIENGDYVEMYNNRVPVQKDYNQAQFSGDFNFTTLLKKGHIQLTRASITGVAVITDIVKPGVSWTYFMHPTQPANSLVPMVPDPISNRYRFKLGMGKIRKLGESPYKHRLEAMSFGRRDIA